jgi:hypothetical protein
MTVSKKQEKWDETQSISVTVHPMCLILNLTFKINDNQLFKFEEYEKMLDICREYVTDENIKRIETYLEDNSDIVKNLIKSKKQTTNNQLSLF